VESNVACLNFPFLHWDQLSGLHSTKHKTYLNVNLVATEDDRNVLADTLQVTMPIGNVFVRDAGGDIKHDDAALSLNIVAIAKTPKLLLASRVPNIETDCTEIGVESQRMHLNTKGS
jgi:hypothetical protein